jgi:hypothetical protein
MSDNLFDIPETLSPRLAWMYKYQVRTHEGPGEYAEFRWTAWLPSDDFDGTATAYDPKSEWEGRIGYGPSEIDAIICLARVRKIKLWNESP